MLKHIYYLSDETVVDRWVENPYWQYFCGETFFQTEKPFHPTEFIHFRKRIDKKGVEKLLKKSIRSFDKKAQEKEILIDSPMQGKNITYSTDAKQYWIIQSKLSPPIRSHITKFNQTELRNYMHNYL